MHRCYCLIVSCILSLHTWYNYPHLNVDNNDNVNSNSYFELYCKNLFLRSYFIWDMYHMTLSSNRKILFRTDLLVRHVVGLYLFFKYINFIPIIWSKFTIAECISLMNYIWRDNKKLLKIYKTFSILFVRIPLFVWFFYYFYNKNKNNNLFDFPYVKTFCFLMIYDAILLWKLYKPKKYLK
jgi:hypothetical protein